jgi:putative membrane protein
MYRSPWFLGLALAVGLCAGGSADDTKPYTDADFVKAAASGGMLEVELGKLATTKASTAGAKMLAETAVKDHTAANEKLKKAATAAGLAFPDKMTDEHQKHLDKFKNYTGSDFEKDYVDHMVKSHESGVKAYTQATKEAKDAGVKAYATETLPTIQQHLEASKKLQGRGK